MLDLIDRVPLSNSQIEQFLCDITRSKGTHNESILWWDVKSLWKVYVMWAAVHGILYTKYNVSE